MASVRLENLVKRFGSVVAVGGVNLEIDDGEFVVLVGPSGCGKSTTLRLIAGLEPITEGHVIFDAEVVDDLEPKERDVAMVFQSYALYPHMNVAGNMGFGLKLQKMNRAEITKRVEEAAALLGITELLERRPRELSGGQRQRVAMGRAIVRQPKLFLFDEPLSNLDANLRSQMRVEIKRLHAQLQTTVVYVTHDQIEAMTLADRIVVMRDGYVAQEGIPAAVYDRPANKFVASFIGAPKMNFLPAELKPHDAGLAVHVTPEIVLPVPPSRREAYAPYAGRPIELGIRPEHLVVGEGTGTGHPSSFQVTIEVVEPMGGETLVVTTVNGAEIAAKCDPNIAVAPGDEVTLTADMGRMHIIEGDDERVVPIPGSAPDAVSAGASPNQ